MQWNHNFRYICNLPIFHLMDILVGLDTIHRKKKPPLFTSQSVQQNLFSTCTLCDNFGQSARFLFVQHVHDSWCTISGLVNRHKRCLCRRQARRCAFLTNQGQLFCLRTRLWIALALGTAIFWLHLLISSCGDKQFSMQPRSKLFGIDGKVIWRQDL
jgi:hypothetical protein